MYPFAILVSALCLAGTLIFVFWADVHIIWKIIAIVVYLATLCLPRVLPGSFLVWSFIRIGLCLVYLSYFTYLGASSR